jgi:glycerol uptake facilitator-like aquaporin
LARAVSDTFAGIRPADAPGFIVAQFLGAAAATLLFRWLLPHSGDSTAVVMISEARENSEAEPVRHK